MWVRILPEGQVSISDNDRLDDIDVAPLSVVEVNISRRNFALFRDLVSMACDGIAPASDWHLLVLDVFPTVVAQAVRSQS